MGLNFLVKNRDLGSGPSWLCCGSGQASDRWCFGFLSCAGGGLFIFAFDPGKRGEDPETLFFCSCFSLKWTMVVEKHAHKGTVFYAKFGLRGCENVQTQLAVAAKSAVWKMSSSMGALIWRRRRKIILSLGGTADKNSKNSPTSHKIWSHQQPSG